MQQSVCWEQCVDPAPTTVIGLQVNPTRPDIITSSPRSPSSLSTCGLLAYKYVLIYVSLWEKTQTSLVDSQHCRSPVLQLLGGSVLATWKADLRVKHNNSCKWAWPHTKGLATTMRGSARAKALVINMICDGLVGAGSRRFRVLAVTLRTIPQAFYTSTAGPQAPWISHIRSKNFIRILQKVTVK